VLGFPHDRSDSQVEFGAVHLPATQWKTLASMAGHLANQSSRGDLARGMVLQQGDGTIAAFRPESRSIWRKLDPIPTVGVVPSKFRVWCRVPPRPRQLGAVPPDPLGGRAAPASPLLLAHLQTDRRGAVSRRRSQSGLQVGKMAGPALDRFATYRPVSVETDMINYD
jgi:hypothetical protein